MTDHPAPDYAQILAIGQGPYAQKLISSAREQGIQFNLDWEDLGRFIKLVNDDWSHDPGAGAGWFPPRVFHGVPRLHLTRTMTILTVTAYLMETLALQPGPLVEAGLSPLQSWCGYLRLENPRPAIQEAEHPPLVLLEVLYVYAPPPVTPGTQHALAETLGLQPFRPETGLGLLYAFARNAGDVQGFSLPFLERDGRLLSACFTELPAPELATRFFLEPLNPTRVAKHLDRYHDLFDMPPALDQAWNRAAVALLGRLVGSERLLA